VGGVGHAARAITAEEVEVGTGTGTWIRVTDCTHDLLRWPSASSVSPSAGGHLCTTVEWADSRTHRGRSRTRTSVTACCPPGSPPPRLEDLFDTNLTARVFYIAKKGHILSFCSSPIAVVCSRHLRWIGGVWFYAPPIRKCGARCFPAASCSPGWG
jgi:hypothetical protein